jgi:hypothetical protein
VAAGALITLYLAGWCAIDKRVPGKYDTVLEFTTEEKKEVAEFNAIQKDKEGKEKSVPFKRFAASAGRADFKDADNHPFRPNSTDWMVVALEIQEDGQPRRFNAILDAKGAFQEPLTYKEVGGKRKMTTAPLGQITWHRSGALLGNILINGMHFLVWFLALWLILRFNWAHALGLGAALWLTVTLVIMPLLFNKTRAKPPLPAGQPPAAAVRFEVESGTHT